VVKVTTMRRRYIKTVRYMLPTQRDGQILIEALDLYALTGEFKETRKLEIYKIREALIEVTYGSQPQSVNVERSEAIQDGKPPEAKP